jgi:hypothetical protein
LRVRLVFSPVILSVNRLRLQSPYGFEMLNQVSILRTANCNTVSCFMIHKT